MRTARRARVALGTVFDVAVDDYEGDAAHLIEESFMLVACLEGQLSAFDTRSELNAVCRIAHRQPVRVSRAFGEVLSTALILHHQSGGIFDVARTRVGPDAAAASSANIDLRRVAGSRSRPWQVRFRRSMRLDFGGIAKGFVIDEVIEKLRSRGARAARVNAGGDLRVLGGASERVWLRCADGFREVARLRDGAFAASSPRRHVDARCGKLATSTHTIAAFAPRAMIADALTKLGAISPDILNRIAPTWQAQWRAFDVGRGA